MTNLMVLFGGQSSEHEVSCKSAQNIVAAVNQNQYHILLVGITKSGKWLFVNSSKELLEDTWRENGIPCGLLPDATRKSLVVFQQNQMEEISVDVIFPVLHGLHGEDGTVQGLFELSQIPYVGCGVLASALGMDKLYTKKIVDDLGIRQAAYVGLYRWELDQMSQAVAKVEAKLSYPVFVKPSCAGSSVGVTKASSAAELREAMLLAAKHDGKILVEETIVGHEVECAVFEDEHQMLASLPGEILAAENFYTYDAKYNNPSSETIMEANILQGQKEEIQEDAKRIFEAIGCHSLSRVDFFVDDQGVVFNEINTLPGFTAISMYPKLMEHMGIDYPHLVEKLIQSAYHRDEH